MEINTYKVALLSLVGIIETAISDLFGGWNSSLTTLLIVMASDYITGMILCTVFKKSPKTTSGTLQSSIG